MNENLNQDVGLTNTYLIKLILTVVASHAKPSYFAEDSDGESAAKTIKQELFRLGRIVDELVPEMSSRLNISKGPGITG